MQFNTILIAALASFAAALPADLADRQAPVCAGTYSNSLCCAADVLQLLDVNCFQPPTVPSNGSNFKAICAAGGQQAKCCALPILGQALLCQDVI